MDLSAHVTALAEATGRFARDAQAAGLDARVPTCPGWSVRDLIAHQGMVHRWATAQVLGNSAGIEVPAAFEEEGLAHADPVSWLVEGSSALIAALAAAPADLEAFVFLADAPAPREFWARRQCHETTIHAADALSARIGGMPSARLSEVSSPVAVDGLDELLTGFLPRPKSKLRTQQPVRVAVRPTDVDRAWIVEVRAEQPAATRHTAEAVELDDADVTFRGTAADLCLGLWNRGDEVTTDDEAMLARWRELARVTWG
ncbi:hypothetical protein N802_10730 [Knoellia sinensis KCTC 19936]|uniref:Mycothiol-dependent maleylpyruvate isomerase metal-binding domain-containing protein n=1 Tax=Knoellia sinensis KCTC 19936 TaxID=1385520 RepID=A0A0A0J4F7_9MICO|nr:maleylpyruvate isomerase N-terminal domain-containing protein [Knoellia sinensis]KGN32068.1 hypothetical protein N802_10730 [Knoellia sinensis KCTC 19936]